MEKIGIIEFFTRNHLNALISKVKIFKVGNYDISIIINEDFSSNIKEEYNLSGVKLVHKKKSISINDFLNDTLKINNFDFLIFNTISPNNIIPFLIFKSKKCKILLHIHNLNNWFGYASKNKSNGLINKIFFKGFMEIINKFLSINLNFKILNLTINSTKKFMITLSSHLYVLLMKSEILSKILQTNFRFILDFLRVYFLKNIDALIVNTNNMKRYAIKNLNIKKPIIVLPFSVFNNNQGTIIEERSYLRVIIPGMIVDERRSYLQTLDVFEKIPERYKNKIVLELLGGPTKTKSSYLIIEKCKILKEKGFKIIFYNHPLYGKSFKQKINQADILFSPIKIGYNNEIYGKTKESGFPFDMIEYAKPGLIPEKINQLKELESSTLYFKGIEEAFKILMSLSDNHQKLKILKEKALKNSLNFTPKKISNDLSNFFNN